MRKGGHQSQVEQYDNIHPRNLVHLPTAVLHPISIRTCFDAEFTSSMVTIIERLKGAEKMLSNSSNLVILKATWYA